MWDYGESLRYGFGAESTTYFGQTASSASLHGQRCLNKFSTLAPEQMTGILIQFKRRLVPSTKAKVEIDQKKLDMFCDAPPLVEGASRRPYITFVLELGVDGHKLDVKTEPPRRSARLSDAAQIYPRYPVFAYGCSSELYSVIKPNESSAYRHLMKKGSLLEEHPFQDDMSLEFVQRLKPWFSHDADVSFEWVKGNKPEAGLGGDVIMAEQ